MASHLCIVHLEDSDNDAELIRLKLEASGIECRIRRARSREEFTAALEAEPPDLIISDFSIPSYNGVMALAAAKQKMPQIPFIFVSGTIGEDAAVESLHNGATDYILKTSDMRRLAPAVRRAMEEVRGRRERSTLEAQYRQAQKMEAVGRLAGGVAHDFNNLLTAILGLSELAIPEIPAACRAQEDLKEIVATVERAAQLTRQLLAFSRKQLVEARVVDLNALVRNVERMLQRIIGEDVELSFLPSADLHPVRIDSGQMEQLIVNLAVNARDAMSGGGKITISTKNVILDQGFVDAHPGSVCGSFALLTVADTGMGISEEAKKHLFEPFFTTKEPGKGTGLGLATCYGIVKQNGGYIGVDSAAGQGTTFGVYLPKVDGTPTPAAKTRSLGKATPSGETLLLVEDEASLRRLTVRMLESQGYRVLEAGDAAEGLRQVQDDGEGRIRLLMTDIVMPKVGGRALAEQIKSLRPEMRILFTSGYADGEISDNGFLEPGVNFIPKPFTTAELAGKVREILDS